MITAIHLTYLFDPLCGWCYGASPVLEKLIATPNVSLTLAPTGLFAGEGARPMDANFAAYAWSNDQRIERLTGQVFSDDYRRNVLAHSDGLFDSAPATLALMAVSVTAPDKEFAALKAIQRLRYVDGRDNTDTSILIGVLRDMGFEDAAGRLAVPDAELLKAYRERTAAAKADMRHFGLEGVPALIAGQGQQRRPLKGQTLFTSPEAVFSALATA